MEEENRSFSNKASTSAAPYPVEQDDDMDEDEDEDGDEEMILVIFNPHKYLVYFTPINTQFIRHCYQN